MEIENANSHPIKVAITSEESEMYANTHPYKVSVVEGGSEFTSELPEKGSKGTTYILVDDAENPSKVYGIYVYDGDKWLLAAQPVDQSVRLVEELPDEGEEGILYYVPKEGETDTYDLYRWLNNSWVKVDTDIVLYQQEGSNTDGAMTQFATTAMKGQAKVLTSADYNWPVDNPTTVALWLLPPGIYQGGVNGVSVRPNTSYHWQEYQTYIVQKDVLYVNILTIGNSLNWSRTNKSNGSGVFTSLSILTKNDIVNNLTSTSTTSVLSANQGKVLKDLVDSLAIRGAGAPTTSTVGSVGKLYEDTTNGKLYICTDATGGSYTWVEVGAGGGASYIELTTSDYDYPTSGTADGIALWNLDTGMYENASGLKIYYTSTLYFTTTKFLVVRTKNTSFNTDIRWAFAEGAYSGSGNAGYADLRAYYAMNYNNGTIYGGERKFLSNDDIASTSGNSSAKVMNQNATTSMVFADPAARRQIQIGTNIANTFSSNDVIAMGEYVTVGAVGAIAIGIGNSSARTIAQGSHSISIGNGAQTVASGGGSIPDSTIAIGGNAMVAGTGSVALGAYSRTTMRGQVDIGTGTQPTFGYNNSNYRLLTGLYDPQSTHDAATKGYVDTAIAGVSEAEEINATDWSALWQ